jgi:hypothetical protein
MSIYQELQLKAKLRKRSPSEPWVEAQVQTATDTDADGSAIVYRYHDPHAFPPGGSATAMVRCPACGIFVPPNSIEHGKCLDHAHHTGWGPSPSALAIAALQRRNIRLRDLDLLPDDPESLQQEIIKTMKRLRRAQKRRVRREKCKASLAKQ